MELLAWPSLTTQEEIKVRAFLRGVTLCELTAAIRQRAERLKLPDAIVCATALEHGVALWTNDQRLHGVPGSTCHPVTLVAAGNPP